MSTTSARGPVDVQSHLGLSAARTPARQAQAHLPTRRPAGLVAGLTAALPFLVTLIALSVGRWSPTGDEAVIAWRSWDVLAGPSPLVGQFTQATSASTVPVFDPGPLLYWVVAPATHLWPGAGAAVAGLGLGAICVLVACLAAGSAGGRAAAWSVAAGMLVLTAALASVVVEAPSWNPYAGLAPFAGLLVVGTVIAVGRIGWLPAGIALGSFVAQTHLMFAPAAALVVLVGGAMGMLRRRGVVSEKKQPARRWLAGTLVVTTACWWPVVVQQLTGHPGNAGALLHATLNGPGPTVGWTRALGAMGEILGPVPAWLHPPASFASSAVEPTGGDAARTVIVLVALVVVCVVALRRGQPGLGAAAAVAVASMAGALWAVAGIGVEAVASYAYIRFVGWPVALVAELVVIWGIGTLAWPGLRRITASRRVVRPLSGLAVLLSVLLSAAAALGSGSQAALGREQPRGAAIAMARSTARLIGRPARQGQRLAVAVTEPPGLTAVSLMTATGYQLRTAGWTPSLPPPWSQVLDPRYRQRPSDPLLGVGPVPPGARVLGQVDVPLLGVGTGRTPTRSTPVWLLGG